MKFDLWSALTRTSRFDAQACISAGGSAVHGCLWRRPSGPPHGHLRLMRASITRRRRRFNASPFSTAEVMIMMMTGMEHVPSDTSGDLNSCNSKHIETCTLAFIVPDDSRNLLTSSKDLSDLAERLVTKPLIKTSKLLKTQTFRPLSGHRKDFQATVYTKWGQQIENNVMMKVKHTLELVQDGHVL